ncbi:alpha-L-fucosidase [uncultured Alistipes sp.]|uniref:alpha-L-fucosidase n=1 Tax=uncultured Alistipes sp. TaxID=538949 RepID=UPI0025F5F49B|nr:alpha-L-fucosidase [uncultured Alistipes sp.]
MKKYLLILCLVISQFAVAQPYEPRWESVDSRPVPAWFAEARFGIFIHWGLYSVPAWATIDKAIATHPVYSEWYWWQKNTDTSRVGDATRAYHKATYGDDFKYPDFVRDFKAERFDPAAWADLFAASGAKYVVLTSKHHEGFALWPSAEAWNWNSVDVGPHRDLAGELSEAVREKGLRMGFYYSLYEWYNPIYLNDVDRYVEQHMLPQMKDLVCRYSPDILWTDGEWEHPSSTWRSEEFLAWLYNESPVRETVVVNDRWGKETRGRHGGFYTTEYDLDSSHAANMSAAAHPWEECRGIGNSFGYNRAETLEHYSSTQQLIVTLIERVARGGNLLLDVGPKADGTIPLVMQERLLGIGAWMGVNGEAIYGTEPWDKAAQNKADGVFFTTKGDDLYVLYTKPQAVLTLKGVATPRRADILGAEARVRCAASKGGVRLTLPAEVLRDAQERPQVVRLAGALK